MSDETPAPSVVERRAAAAARLAELRRQAADALLSGEPADSMAIAAAEAELAALPNLARAMEVAAGRGAPLPIASSILGAAAPAAVPAIAAVDAAERPPTLAERRATAETRVEGLRERRADALLRGEPIDSLVLSAIAAPEAELAGIGDAEQLAHDREREAAVATRRRNAAAARSGIRRHLADRLAAIDRAQQAFERGAAELRHAADALDEARQLALRLGSEWPIVFHRSEAANRASRRIAAALQGLGFRNEYGVLRWRSLPPEIAATWQKAESAATSGAAQALAGEDIGDGSPAGDAG